MARQTPQFWRHLPAERRQFFFRSTDRLRCEQWTRSSGFGAHTGSGWMATVTVTFISSNGIGVQQKGRYRLDRILGEGACGHQAIDNAGH